MITSYLTHGWLPPQFSFFFLDACVTQDLFHIKLCTRDLLASLDHHFKEAGSSISLPRTEFVNSPKILEGKIASSVKRATENVPMHQGTNNAQDEEMFLSKGLFGSQSPMSLIATIWFVLMQCFRIRSCQEHRNMYVKDFSFSCKTTMSSISAAP